MTTLPTRHSNQMRALDRLNKKVAASIADIIENHDQPFDGREVDRVAMRLTNTALTKERTDDRLR